MCRPGPYDQPFVETTPRIPDPAAPNPRVLDSAAAAPLSSPTRRPPLLPNSSSPPPPPPPRSGVGPSAPRTSPSPRPDHRAHLHLRPSPPTPRGCRMPSDESTAQVRVEGDILVEKVEETQDQNEVGGMPSRQEEEAAIKKKYGGILPRKTPLISKDHERAYFDSADWALGKQGGVPNKPKGPLEALRPKLQPTQQNARTRRTPYASADNDETLNLPAEDLSPDGESVEDKSKE